MLKFGFGGKVKPRRFDFIPRYYDEQKEDLEQRLGVYDEEKKEEYVKDRIKAGIRQRYNADRGFRNREVRKSNFRLLYVFIILILVSYLIIRSDKFAKMLEYLGS